MWFGAAAPLALLAGRARRAGAHRILASTHGHEVGWSMLPVARSALRRIGDTTDVVTFVSRYTAAGSPRRSARGPAWNTCRPASTPTDSARPGRAGRAARPVRPGERPTIVCVSRLVPRKARTC